VLKEADYRWEVWADWWASHIDQSAIGYPALAVEARMSEHPGDKPPAHSISPEVMMPPRVAEIDRLYRCMQADWLPIIRRRYMERVLLKRREYVELDRIHHWTAGRLNLRCA